MRMNGMVLCGSLILLIGCSNMKKNAQAPDPVTPAATAQVSAQAKGSVPAVAPVAATAAEPAKESLLCKRGSEVRSMEVESLQPKGCKLWYSRYGNRDSVASSDKANTHCENIRDRIKKNLETVNFTCTAGAISQNKSPTVVKSQSVPQLATPKTAAATPAAPLTSEKTATPEKVMTANPALTPATSPTPTDSQKK